MGNTEKMIQAQKDISAEKTRYAKEVIDTMQELGETITPYTVWKKSKLSKSFIYGNKEVMEYLEQFRSEKKYNFKKYTPEDVKSERIEQLEKEVALLRKELAHYKNVTLESLTNENQILRHRLEQYQKLEKMGLIQLIEDI